MWAINAVCAKAAFKAISKAPTAHTLSPDVTCSRTTFQCMYSVRNLVLPFPCFVIVVVIWFSCLELRFGKQEEFRSKD